MINNYLTIDVEDYFQVAAFDDLISSEDWSTMESRVERNTCRLLELLEQRQVKATFFVVGWIAEKHPALVRRIDAGGHEIGCHSYLHRKIYDMDPKSFREDTRQAKELLEDLTGKKVLGYRAPSYSITGKSLWALDILAELGFVYDSSIFPIRHDLYGIPGAPRFPYKLPKYNLVEYPPSTAMMLGRKIPVAGGGYFRLFPYHFTQMALEQINGKEKQPFIFYLHPWEIDPHQPRIRRAGPLSRFRHYNNLAKTEDRLKRLLGNFSFRPIQAPEYS